MRAGAKIVFFNSEGEKFFGEGPFQLLSGVEETGSLRASADKMGMAYTKALKLLNNAEKSLGFPLTERVTGGKNGGGSRLTKEGKRWLERYEAYARECREACDRLYRQHFKPVVGCVVMASGEGKRFGKNKLLADFNSGPLIKNALDLASLFEKSVVVTRSEDTSEYCKGCGMATVLHTLPYRSDTVRLGLEALGDMDACIFLQGDQPLLSRELVESLRNAWEESPEYIWQSAYGERVSSPVIFPKRFFEELKSLPEGEGGGAVIRRYPHLIRHRSASRECELFDVDTPDDLEKIKKVLVSC